MKLNLKRVSIILGMLVFSLGLFQFFISCEISRSGFIAPLGSSSTDNNNTNNDDTDDDDDDTKTRICDDRESCRDSCDYIFKNASAKSDCYDLDFDELNDYELVFDELSTKNLNKRDLEKIDEDAFREFLKLSSDGWLDLIDGSRDTGRRKVRSAYTSTEAKEALEWIAENEDIADALADHDDDRDILYELFVRHGSDKNSNLKSLKFQTVGHLSNYTNIIWKPNLLEIGKGQRAEESVSLNDPKIFDFIISYMGLDKSTPNLGEHGNNNFSFRGDSFVQYAEREDNDSAVDLAHSTLVEFCKNAVDEDDEDDEDVKRCLLAVYCGIETTKDSKFFVHDRVLSTSNLFRQFGNNGVPESFDPFFKDSPFRLDDEGEKMCSYETFTDENDKLDNYF